MLSIKHTLASKTDTKPTVSNREIIKLLGQQSMNSEILLYYHDFNCSIKYHSSRGGTTWYAEQRFPSRMIMPQVGTPVYYNVSVVVDDVIGSMRLSNEFQPIRDWATQRGLYKNGDMKTQVVKLQEEVGELSRAILKEDYNEIADAIGDSVVVLTNLAELTGLNIETCINDAYSQIRSRKGKMINGTFVKNG